MTKEEAIRNIAIALGWSIRAVERAANNLIQDKIDADVLMAQIEATNQTMPNNIQTRKSYVSPYAKFDKFHHKKKRK